MGGLFSAPKIKKPELKPDKLSDEAKMRERRRRAHQKMLSTNIFAGGGLGQLGRAPTTRPQIFAG